MMNHFFKLFSACLFLFMFNYFPELIAISSGIDFPFSQETTNNQLTQSNTNGDQYGIMAQDVFKLDSAGNTIWVREFSQPITTWSSYGNVLNSITQNGNRLFIRSLQGPGPNQTGQNYPATIVLDTAGNLLDISYMQAFSSVYRQDACLKASNGGVWCLTDEGGSLVSMVLYRTDVHGKQDTSSPIRYFQYRSSYFSEVLDSYFDSTYVIALSSVDYNTPNPALIGALSLLKMDYSGNIRWSYLFYSTSYQGHHRTFPYKFAIDAIGNIYLAYYHDEYNSPNNFEGLALSKIDIGGRVQFAKCWTQIPMRNCAITAMSVHNDSVYVEAKPYSSGSSSFSLTFDTAFNNACMAPDSVIQLDRVGFPYQSIPDYYYEPSVIYNPIVSSRTHTISPTLLAPDYCNILGVEENTQFIHSGNGLNVYPNPVSIELFISFTNSAEKMKSVELYDFKGSLIKSENFPGTSYCTFNLEKYSEGVYFVKVKSSEKAYFEKIILRR